MFEKDSAALYECLYAIDHIEAYTYSIVGPSELINDHKTYDAVLMNFIIVGEAVKRISNELKEEHPELDWRSIIGFRNFVAHDYFGVDINIVWAAIKIHLPQFKKQIKALL
jgi:uncharacterized protein with HEPN domain